LRTLTYRKLADMGLMQLRSGRLVTIRAIRQDDGARLQAAYDRLSPESKYRRFLAPKPHLTEADTRYLVQVDGSDHVAFVATPAEDPESILAVGRFVRLPEDPKAAEFAVVVGEEFRREGLATGLIERLARTATEHGIARLRATMLAQNPAAHGLVRGLSQWQRHERHFGPVDEIELELAA
jgi:RimJ/RimL family protein N-acetyltransferase